ncbi:methyltransferase domain-containing protein [Coraliomargarita sp. SDUM461004]|uniref:Methyltransferase domain-containing protein n=1 Tax=Thalassobacterium sedimentorum TaxID=3041258 RepID=A0ABU1ALE1_9BACT|nr:methyltransferase domain-containing protein [Coraliomargarita sp. SDUM461004]MDQ8195569.1 methyltransferase domain-containing protein [Coraliomargarita sp. SDUM461004]
MANYDSAFFDYVNSGALKSAEALLPILNEPLQPKSILDAGCGQGGWLTVWKKLGAHTVLGIDGDYVVREELLVEPSEFTPIDLSKPFNLERRFDLVQSLEVGEHLPTQSSADFIASLVKHSDFILFSAAARGQGGDSHVNEQDYDFWRKLFASHDYVAIDYLRPKIIDNQDIEAWYRYNPFLYVARNRVTELPQTLQDCIIPDDQALKDLSPALYQFRKSIVRLLPVSIATKIAKIKEAIVVKLRGQ